MDRFLKNISCNENKTRVFLALGSNIEPREAYLRRAVHALVESGDVIAVAPLYESPAYGETAQPDFLNTAVQICTDISPLRLLDVLKTLEKNLGRQPGYHWGPRQIDIDIIFYGRQRIHQPRLQIPHRDYRNRRFVLRPLADIAPDFIAPDTNMSIQAMLDRCPDTVPITHYKTDWIANARAS